MRHFHNHHCIVCHKNMNFSGFCCEQCARSYNKDGVKKDCKFYTQTSRCLCIIPGVNPATNKCDCEERPGCAFYVAGTTDFLPATKEKKKRIVKVLED